MGTGDGECKGGGDDDDDGGGEDNHDDHNKDNDGAIALIPFLLDSKRVSG